jgi:hypothetical protein
MLANALPGGELLIEEQDEIIAMLERLREKKRYVSLLPPFFFRRYRHDMHMCSFCFPSRAQLREFSDKVIDTKAAGYHVPQYASAVGGVGAGGGSNAQMEVDSNASTPA